MKMIVALTVQRFFARTTSHAYACAIVLFGFVGTAQAAVLIDQNFDDTSVFVNGAQLGLPGTGNSSTTAGLWRQGLSAPGGSVANDQSYSPSQSITTVRTTFGKGQVLGYVDNAQGLTSGLAETSFRFQRATSSAAASFRLGYSSDIAVFDNINLGVEINTDGTVNVVDNASPIQILTGVTSSTWHAFKLLVDIGAKKYDVYYSADATDAGYGLVYSGATVPTLYSSGGSVNCMWWGPNFDGGTVYFDNAYLAGVPEPSSMMLFALGGLALSWCGSRRTKAPH
jgi:hypothetical protein